MKISASARRAVIAVYDAAHDWEKSPDNRTASVNASTVIKSALLLRRELDKCNRGVAMDRGAQ